MRLNVFKETTGRIPLTRLQKMFRKLSEEEKKPGWEGTVNLVFTDDKRMRSLNREFRQLDQPTDVLAFTIDHPVSPECMFGEIYVSVSMAGRQAQEDGTTLAEVLIRLSCHGLLHLFGYDHLRKRDAEQMTALEKYYVGFSKRPGHD